MMSETRKSRIVKNITPSDFMGGVLNFTTKFSSLIELKNLVKIGK